jgi:hypothetical protein
MTAAAVAAAIRARRYRYATEEDLQQGILEALIGQGFAARREVRLSPRNRIDLLVGRIGIEVKVGGIGRNVERQLARYAASDLIDGLVLVTNRARHQPPATIDGKPVELVWLSGVAL